MPFEDLAHLAGYLAIAWKVRRQECCVRAKTFGPNSGHGGTYAELSRFIRSSTHYGAIPAPCDNDGLATELRVVALLDGRIKRVHVDMNDFASGHLANHLIPRFRPVRAFAYLPGLCFPRERDATKNAGTLGFVT